VLCSAIVQSELFDPSTLSQYILTRFAESSAEDVRIEAAKNPNTPKDVLFELLDDEEEVIVASVRKNPALSPEDISVLLDQAEDIKNDNSAGYGIEIIELLANPNIGVGYLEHYYQEFQNEDAIDSNFIETLIENPKTPLEIRKDIATKYGRFMPRYKMQLWKEKGLIPESFKKVLASESVVSKQSLTSLLF
jgi:hypothetical protein